MMHIFERLLRGFALFLGLFALANLVLIAAGRPGYDASIWWIDLRDLPAGMAVLVCLGFGLALVHRASWPVRGGPRVLWVRQAVLLLLAVWLGYNTLVVWRLHLTPGNGVTLGVPVPLTLVTGGLAAMLVRTPRGLEARGGQSAEVRRRPSSRFASGMTIASGFAATALLAPSAQMACYGQTDYRRPANAIVVYGCRAYADGRPSQALADRVHTACDLYHQGLAPCIVMSGGPGDGDIHETQAMRDYAIALGVPPQAILRDNHGLDTQATADNLRGVLSSRWSAESGVSVLAVSHDFHLPRAKLTLERQGFRAYTVPADVRRGLPSKPYLVMRETAAWWVYWGRP